MSSSFFAFLLLFAFASSQSLAPIGCPDVWRGLEPNTTQSTFSIDLAYLCCAGCDALNVTFSETFEPLCDIGLEIKPASGNSSRATCFASPGIGSTTITVTLKNMLLYQGTLSWPDIGIVSDTLQLNTASGTTTQASNEVISPTQDAANVRFMLRNLVNNTARRAVIGVALGPMTNRTIYSDLDYTLKDGYLDVAVPEMLSSVAGLAMQFTVFFNDGSNATGMDTFSFPFLPFVLTMNSPACQPKPPPPSCGGRGVSGCSTDGTNTITVIGEHFGTKLDDLKITFGAANLECRLESLGRLPSAAMNGCLAIYAEERTEPHNWNLTNLDQAICRMPIGIGKGLVVILKKGQLQWKSQTPDWFSYGAATITSISAPECTSQTDLRVVGCPRSGGVRVTINGNNFGNGTGMETGLQQTQVACDATSSRQNYNSASARVFIGGRECTELAHDPLNPHHSLSCALPRGRGEKTIVLLPAGGELANTAGVALSYEVCLPGQYFATEENCLVCCLPCAPGYASSSLESPSCTACPAGRYSLGNASDCEACPQGSFSASSAQSFCSPCEAGKYQAQVGQPQCNKCGPGLVSTVNSTTESSCVPCPAGRYLNDSSGVCDRCTPGEVRPDDPTQIQCTACSNQEVANRDQTGCESCLGLSGALSSSLHVEPNADRSRCVCSNLTTAKQSAGNNPLYDEKGLPWIPTCIPCPVGADCSGPGNEQHSMLASAGYFADLSGLGETFYQCFGQHACVNGTCAPEYWGNLCQRCSPGYGSLMDWQCVRCGPDSIKNFFLVAFACIFCSLAYSFLVGIWFATLPSVAEVEKLIEAGEPPPPRAVSNLPTLLKICISTMSLNALSVPFGMLFEPPSGLMKANLYVFGTGIFYDYSLECALRQMSIEDHFYFIEVGGWLISPLVFVALFFPIVFLLTRSSMWPKVSLVLFNAISALFFLFHPVLTLYFFELWQCSELDQVTHTRYLMRDRTQACEYWNSEYYGLVAIFSVFGVLWVFVAPLALTLVLVLKREFIWAGMPKRGKQGNLLGSKETQEFVVTQQVLQEMPCFKGTDAILQLFRHDADFEHASKEATLRMLRNALECKETRDKENADPNINPLSRHPAIDATNSVKADNPEKCASLVRLLLATYGETGQVIGLTTQSSVCRIVMLEQIRKLCPKAVIISVGDVFRALALLCEARIKIEKRFALLEDIKRFRNERDICFEKLETLKAVDKDEKPAHIQLRDALVADFNCFKVKKIPLHIEGAGPDLDDEENKHTWEGYVEWDVFFKPLYPEAALTAQGALKGVSLLQHKRAQYAHLASDKSVEGTKARVFLFLLQQLEDDKQRWALQLDYGHRRLIEQVAKFNDLTASIQRDQDDSVMIADDLHRNLSERASALVDLKCGNYHRFEDVHYKGQSLQEPEYRLGECPLLRDPLFRVHPLKTLLRYIALDSPVPSATAGSTIGGDDTQPFKSNATARTGADRVRSLIDNLLRENPKLLIFVEGREYTLRHFPQIQRYITLNMSASAIGRWRTVENIVQEACLHNRIRDPHPREVQVALERALTHFMDKQSPPYHARFKIPTSGVRVLRMAEAEQEAILAGRKPRTDLNRITGAYDPADDPYNERHETLQLMGKCERWTRGRVNRWWCFKEPPGLRLHELIQLYGSRLTFWTHGYRPRTFYWELMVVLRKSLFVMLAVIGSADKSNDHVRHTFAPTLLALFLIIHFAMRPYVSRLMDFMEFLSLGTMYVNFYSESTRQVVQDIIKQQVVVSGLKNLGVNAKNAPVTDTDLFSLKQRLNLALNVDLESDQLLAIDTGFEQAALAANFGFIAMFLAVLLWELASFLPCCRSRPPPPPEEVEKSTKGEDRLEEKLNDLRLLIANKGPEACSPEKYRLSIQNMKMHLYGLRRHLHDLVEGNSPTAESAVRESLLKAVSWGALGTYVREKQLASTTPVASTLPTQSLGVRDIISQRLLGRRSSQADSEPIAALHKQNMPTGAPNPKSAPSEISVHGQIPSYKSSIMPPQVEEGSPSNRHASQIDATDQVGSRSPSPSPSRSTSPHGPPMIHSRSEGKQQESTAAPALSASDSYPSDIENKLSPTNNNPNNPMIILRPNKNSDFKKRDNNNHNNSVKNTYQSESNDDDDRSARSEEEDEGSGSQTDTRSLSGERSGTASRTRSGTASRTRSGTASRTRSGTASRTRSGTASQTQSGTASRTQSGDPSRTQSGDRSSGNMSVTGSYSGDDSEDSAASRTHSGSHTVSCSGSRSASSAPHISNVHPSSTHTTSCPPSAQSGSSHPSSYSRSRSVSGSDRDVSRSGASETESERPSGRSDRSESEPDSERPSRGVQSSGEEDDEEDEEEQKHNRRRR